MLRKLIAAATAATVIMTLVAAVPVSAENTDTAVQSVTVSESGNTYESYAASFDKSDSFGTENSAEVKKEISSQPVIFNVEIQSDGVYKLGFTYKPMDNGTSNLIFGIKLDGLYAFDEAKAIELPRTWKLGEEKRIDGLGNEFSPEIEPSDKNAFNYALDTSGWSVDPYLFYLEKGTHSLEIVPVDGSFFLDSVTFSPNESVQNYTAPSDSSKKYDGDPLIIEGEDAEILSTYWLIPRSDNSSASVTPKSDKTSKINYIGGSTWKAAGEYITWKTYVKKAGYYRLGFSYRQSAVINGSTYRMLTIDGELPFAEASEISFGYSTDWEGMSFCNEDGEPYLIYFDEGEHEITLTATPGSIVEISMLLKDTVADLGDLYMQITKITGDTPDNYRDYALFEAIPDMEAKVESGIKNLKKASELLQTLSGNEGSSYDSTVKAMQQVLTKMDDNKYTAHRYVTDYYSKYCSLASVLNEMREMPLEIDRIILASPDEDIDYGHAGFFKQTLFSSKKFLASFVSDYSNISGVDEDEEHLTIWVNWGRDQAQVLNFLIQSSFTEETGIPVDIKVTNATVVQSVLSGRQPDVILQQPRSEPLNLAIRNVLLDLSEFEDCDEVLSRFQQGAETPYRYKDGLYALPDTQTFFLMFYRTDIFESMGLSVPKTWDEFISTAKLLAKNNMDVWLPYTQITTVNQVNTGIGSLNIFSSLLLQNGLSLYTEDGRATTLTDTDTIKIFQKWTDFYTKLKVPLTMSFYNRFRVGTCPLGIEQYTNFTTLKAAAPEIEGLWAVSEIPGTVLEDNTVDHTSSGGGTGCCILKETKIKDKAWEFLKWWTREDTQLSYTNNLESVLGPTGRVAVSNVNAFSHMSWDTEMKDDIVSAWKNVKEIEEVPGSYYVTRAVDLSFWNVANQNKNPKDVLIKWGLEVDDEIERKWSQYENRG